MKYRNILIGIVVLIAAVVIAVPLGIGISHRTAHDVVATGGRLGHEPGKADFAQFPNGPFVATPNFYYFESCGRPCWLPLYSTPRIDSKHKVTKDFPFERLETDQKLATGDQLVVMCQVHGQTLEDDLGHVDGHYSNIWDLVIVPKDKVQPGLKGLKKAPDGENYLAYGSDLWFGNTGWHDIGCT